MLLAAALLAGAAAPVVVSPRAERVAVTIYRAPWRGRGDRMDLNALGGFAMVTETRTVRLPRGEAVIRFEGVAGGIVPVSAIVTGLPGGTVEKNRDARLLSPAALVDGTLGRQVTLRRTDRASGAVVVEDATIIAGPARGVVVRTARGVEALGCAGLADAPLYRAVPPDLSATPVLSVTTRSPAARRVTVTLAYLASGFDWSASYVATVAPGGRTLDLFAWTTLANSNAERFADADVKVVAGRLNRRATRDWPAAAAALRLSCYPLGTTTSDLNAEIVVTGSRVVRAAASRQMRIGPMLMSAPVLSPPAPPPPPPPPEDLGDLKLYRLRERVTVAANAQKQVALIDQRGVGFARVYRADLRYPSDSVAATVVLRLRNDAAGGLGVPLPAGTTMVSAPRGGRALVAGTGTLADTAVGEDVDIAAGTSGAVRASRVRLDATRSRVSVTNALPEPVVAEIPLAWPGQSAPASAGAALTLVKGAWTWRATVPPNGTATIDIGP